MIQIFVLISVVIFWLVLGIGAVIGIDYARHN